MKRTVWRALLAVAFLSIVFVALPVSATILVAEPVNPPDNSASVAAFSPLAPTDAVSITWTVTPTEINQYGPYYLTYQAVITNNTGSMITTLPVTFTLDPKLSLVALRIDDATTDSERLGTVVLSNCLVVLPSGGTVITLTGRTEITPGGHIILPDGGTVLLVPGHSLYLAPGGTMLMPGGGTMSLPNPVISWQANDMPANGVATMTLRAQGVALWPENVTTMLQVFDDPSQRLLTTTIAPTATAGLSVITRGPTAARQGDVITYTIAFSNVTQLPVYNVWVTDTLPTGVVPLPGVQTTMFVPVAPPAQVFEYWLPVRVMTQGERLINRVSVVAMGLQLDPIGQSTSWETIVEKFYRLCLSLFVRR